MNKMNECGHSELLVERTFQKNVFTCELCGHAFTKTDKEWDVSTKKEINAMNNAFKKVSINYDALKAN